jgi:putative ABC transport system ATP-binding protein
VTSPSIIFADEPTGELDSANSLAIGQLLRRVVDEQKITMLIATHDLSLAGITDRIIELVDGAIAKETVNAVSRR